MFDWDKIIIDVDDNAVDLTAGEVSLLIGADADTVTWGNITGDLTQQADLMLELDSKIDVDSPEFTGIPRTPTPPAGNSSTRIANTKFVKESVDAIVPPGGFGALASQDNVDYQTQVTNKPTLGALASKDSVNLSTDASGIMSIENGGTGGDTIKDARENLEVAKSGGRTEIYVNGSTGDDSTADGSNSHPFQTIYEAVEFAPYLIDTKIYVKSGNYSDSVTIRDKRITFEIGGSGDDGTGVQWSGCIYVSGGYLNIGNNFKLRSQGQSPIQARNGATVVLDRTYFNSPNDYAITVEDGSTLICENTLTFETLSNTPSHDGILCDSASKVFTNAIAGKVSGVLLHAKNGAMISYVTISANAQYGTKELKETGGSICKGSFGALAHKDDVDYLQDVRNKPTLGALASKNSVDYETEVYNKPTSEAIEYAPEFWQYYSYKIGDYVKYDDSLYRFILDHNATAWDSMDVVETHYSRELSTGEKTIKLSESNESLESLIRGAGAHANTKIVVDTNGSHNVKTLVISGHKKISVWSSNDGSSIARFNGDYGTEKHLQNLFYSIIVENGAILELKGYTKVWHADSNGILIRNGGMVIHHGILDIDLPSENYHDGIYIESGGKFISDGAITATRGSTVYQDYPSHVIYVDYGSEAHVNSISASYYNYAIGCRGGLASYNSISGAGVTTSAGGRIFTGAQ